MSMPTTADDTRLGEGPLQAVGDVRLPPAGSTPRQEACKQCRARHVKCDRVKVCCGACSRLSFHCSFGGPSENPEPDSSTLSHPSLLTQAGTKRKRVQSACLPCRKVKAKCSGDEPCARCRCRGIQCVRSEDSNTQNQQPAEPLQHLGFTFSSAPPPSSAIALDKVTMRQYIEAYFAMTNPSTCIFLHRPTVLADWSRGRLNTLLQTALCASGMRLLALRTRNMIPRGKATARAWMQRVQTSVLMDVKKQSMDQLQILVLIIQFHFFEDEIAEAWNLLSLAARLAFTLGLNEEHEDSDPVVQESRRRLIWAVYLLDRMFSGGIEDLAVCPVNRLRIRLPCDDRSFQRGISSRAEYLDDTLHPTQTDRSHMDLLAYHTRLAATRDRILSYTKHVRREGLSPVASKNQLETLQTELQHFEETLPEDLRLNSERLLLMAQSSDSGAYVLLHTHWLQCHCDLYRFLIPGIRESVNKADIEATPPDFVEFCQKACLSKAIQLCELWSEIADVEFCQPIEDFFLSISIYQVAQIVHHLHHLLPRQGSHSLGSLKTKLEKALQVVSFLQTHFPRGARCFVDTEHLVQTLGHSGSSTGSESEDQDHRYHLTSKHSLIPKIWEQTDAAKPDDDIALRILGEPALSASVKRVGREIASLPGAAPQLGSLSQIPNAMGAEGMSPVFGGHEGFIQWDPFDMQLNDYHDPQLGGFGLSFPS
ncbi:fungal-specific transcription factor domain-containing protein [Pseudomassariella vexata]|uniref:Fungal-specific transcription factor domain-domain-containing protein n=1 Tax=Pseudomassariella vexata TaxID=1141098 RepID=A0A1Y2D5W3_9PEZI|nr:fungal-specific transcription factor domain-containing protein [Pseudomassariella vexata]ORY54699.1 fungal-specific transcription factor domain-domain-containing protein [Pseudomassariella vexata]